MLLCNCPILYVVATRCQPATDPYEVHFCCSLLPCRPRSTASAVQALVARQQGRHSRRSRHSGWPAQGIGNQVRGGRAAGSKGGQEQAGGARTNVAVLCCSAQQQPASQEAGWSRCLQVGVFAGLLASDFRVRLGPASCQLGHPCTAQLCTAHCAHSQEWPDICSCLCPPHFFHTAGRAWLKWPVGLRQH